MARITNKHMIGKLKAVFTRRGVPESLKTDNSGQFTSETFQKFAVDYDFRQVLPGHIMHRLMEQEKVQSRL